MTYEQSDYIEEQDEFVSQLNVHINDLPSEILLAVFCNLSPVDLKDARLVCRQWNNVILDKAAWIRAFDNKFQTGDVFASVTGSDRWILEYFGRLASLRTWAKAKSWSKLYSLVNNEYGQVDQIVADFVHDRLLTFSRALGTVTSCTLTLGKNQVFIPENHVFASTLAYDVNWTYLCVGKISGEIYLKNLITATSSGSSRTSVTCLKTCAEPVAGVRMNPDFDKHRERADILAVTKSGILQFLDLDAHAHGEIRLDDTALYLDSDFKSRIVVITSKYINVIDFASRKPLQKIAHGWDLDAKPCVCDVDFYDSNVVLGLADVFKVFHIDEDTFSVAEGNIHPSLSIIGGTIQECDKERNTQIAGGDGRLYALTISNGSVAVFELREARSPIEFKTTIMPFADDRTPQNIHMYTKVALNSSVIAIGALADWIHFYDSHSGHYLREGAKVSRKLTRNGMVPILYIKFAHNGAGGVVVSGDVVQYFKFGESLLDSKRPNTPQDLDMRNKRTIQQHIKNQLDEYTELEHHKEVQAQLADKFNGTTFESEQEELRVAMALSASTVDVEDSDFERVLALLREDVASPMSHQIEMVEDWESPEPATYNVGSSRALESAADAEELEDEILQRVLKLSMLEH